MGNRKATPAASVDQFLAGLEHPFKADVEALRQVILSAAEGIGEEVKWNAPSFCTGEHFATMRLPGKVPLQLILHLGAKKRELPPYAIEDPAGLLVWLGPDRACVNFAGPGDVRTRASALRAVLRQWVRHVPERAA
ncbi:DUF1801 domain-containing protein [Lysobacter koreensis]|uniref:DUF1801 domain-containing protein n=1 Tax=Lysobacter koreensis TaxID=266122 RepID=A0ABW2YIM9_9GAMM